MAVEIETNALLAEEKEECKLIASVGHDFGLVIACVIIIAYLNIKSDG